MSAFPMGRANGPMRPRIGPCHDPRLWFLEWSDKQGRVWRLYYADRAEAQKALRAQKKKAARR